MSGWLETTFVGSKKFNGRHVSSSGTVNPAWFVILFLLLIQLPGQAEGVEKRWTAAAGTAWFDHPDNWDPPGVPGPEDYLNLTAAPGLLVAVRQPHTVQDLEFGKLGMILEILSGGILNLIAEHGVNGTPPPCETISLSGGSLTFAGQRVCRRLISQCPIQHFWEIWMIHLLLIWGNEGFHVFMVFLGQAAVVN